MLIALAHPTKTRPFHSARLSLTHSLPRSYALRCTTHQSDAPRNCIKLSLSWCTVGVGVCVKHLTGLWTTVAAPFKFLLSYDNIATGGRLTRCVNWPNRCPLSNPRTCNTLLRVLHIIMMHVCSGTALALCLAVQLLLNVVTIE